MTVLMFVFPTPEALEKWRRAAAEEEIEFHVHGLTMHLQCPRPASEVETWAREHGLPISVRRRRA